MKNKTFRNQLKELKCDAISSKYQLKLIEEAQKGNKHAMECLIARNSELIQRRVDKVVSEYPNIDGEDLFSHCVLELIEYFMTYKNNRKSHLTILIASKINISINNYIQENSIFDEPINYEHCPNEEMMSVEDQVIYNHFRNYMLSFLVENLTEIQLKAVIYTYYKKFTLRNTSKIMECTHENVRAAYSKARKSLLLMVNEDLLAFFDYDSKEISNIEKVKKVKSLRQFLTHVYDNEIIEILFAYVSEKDWDLIRRKNNNLLSDSNENKKAVKLRKKLRNISNQE